MPTLLPLRQTQIKVAVKTNLQRVSVCVFVPLFISPLSPVRVFLLPSYAPRIAAWHKELQINKVALSD